MGYDNYLKIRHVEQNNDPQMPMYLKKILPDNKQARILDIGCGYGNLLYGIRECGYTNLQGIDLDENAVAYVNSQNVLCQKISIMDFVPEEKFEFVTMSHVLEHLPKEDVITALDHIRNNVLCREGKLVLMVPNGQSYIGCYWAYEDFTHNTLFTAGSLEYVCKCAGFKNTEVLDPYGISNNPWYIKILRRFFMGIFGLWRKFWMKISGSAYHAASPVVYTWEIKLLTY